MADFTLEEMRHQAYEQLCLHAEPDCKPSIVGEEAAILERHMRCGVWTPSTLYIYGDEVQLYPRNGRRYMCIQTGTSSSTAPDWSSYPSSRMADGTANWEEVGPDYDNVFDVRGAAHECWTIKAARATHLVNTPQIEAAQLQENCRARAREFTPVL